MKLAELIATLQAAASEVGLDTEVRILMTSQLGATYAVRQCISFAADDLATGKEEDRAVLLVEGKQGDDMSTEWMVAMNLNRA